MILREIISHYSWIDENGVYFAQIYLEEGGDLNGIL